METTRVCRQPRTVGIPGGIGLDATLCVNVPTSTTEGAVHAEDDVAKSGKLGGSNNVIDLVCNVRSVQCHGLIIDLLFVCTCNRGLSGLCPRWELDTRVLCLASGVYYRN